jgi:hypothetical protein
LLRKGSPGGVTDPEKEADMLRTSLNAVVALALLLAGLAASVSLAASEARHTGTVVAVEPDRRRIAIEEMGPWVGPRQGVVKLWIALAPQTKVAAITRSEGPGKDGWAGNFAAAPLTADAIKPGDFVTVTTETRDGRLVARSVEVLRPGPEGGAR